MDDEHGNHGLAAEHAELRLRYMESQARFADVFRFAPCVMLITRLRDHTILDVNEAFEQESGYSRDSVLGRRTTDFPWWQNPALRDRILSEISQKGRLSNIETRFFDKDNREHISLLSGQLVTMNGEPCVVWQTLDVTETVRAQEQKEVLETRIKQQEKLESLGLLAGGVAHDFNNLLVGVLGNAEAALVHLSAKSPAHALMRSVLMAGERAAELTRELLDYAGRGTTKLEPIEALTLLWETAELVRPALPKNVSVRMESSDMHLWLLADASQLRRLFMNLIKNAAEAFAGGPGQVLVSAHADEGPDGEWVRVRVRDTGLGMDEATRARLFEPFFTTKTGGHGLGLAAVQGVVHKHGGSIDVTSAHGEGTLFSIRLPRHETPILDHEPEPTLEFQGQGGILLIDDEPQVRATTSMLLELHGFEVRTAASGEAGLAMFTAEPGRYRAVVLDSTMPGLDGAETLRRLRTLHTSLPVLLCSGYSKHDLVALLDADPHVRFLSKPFRRRDLSDALRALLGEG